MTDNNPNGGYSVKPDDVRRIAKDLKDAADDFHKHTKDMRTVMFAGDSRSSVPAMLFGEQKPNGPWLGQRYNDLIDGLANFGYALGTTMSDGAEQLSKAGDIYAQTDEEAGKSIPN